MRCSLPPWPCSSPAAGTECPVPLCASSTGAAAGASHSCLLQDGLEHPLPALRAELPLGKGLG